MVMLKIDGSVGEGGGQVLRTSLALSVLTGQPFQIENIRGKRKKPGLLRQHLTGVRAAARISNAHVDGDELGSLRLRFEPGPVVPGVYEFAVGTAGSATLVLQTILPPLLTVGGPSRIRVEGGTHNPLSPPFDFLERTFLRVVNRMGVRVNARLERWGFAPAGGGAMELEIYPAERLQPFTLLKRGEILRRHARAVVACLPANIAHRELSVVRDKLAFGRNELEVYELPKAHAPGNLLQIELETESHVELFTAFGRRDVRAAEVGEDAVRQVREYLAHGEPVGEHLADQLLIPLAMAGGGAFRTGPPSLHMTTNVDIIGKFLSVPIRCREVDPGAWEVGVQG
jgi:RNA 3'-terminal phosphate cyclase (ATP)